MTVNDDCKKQVLNWLIAIVQSELDPLKERDKLIKEIDDFIKNISEDEQYMTVSNYLDANPELKLNRPTIFHSLQRYPHDHSMKELKDCFHEIKEKI